MAGRHAQDSPWSATAESLIRFMAAYAKLARLPRRAGRHRDLELIRRAAGWRPAAGPLAPAAVASRRTPTDRAGADPHLTTRRLCHGHLLHAGREGASAAFESG